MDAAAPRAHIGSHCDKHPSVNVPSVTGGLTQTTTPEITEIAEQSVNMSFIRTMSLSRVGTVALCVFQTELLQHEASSIQRPTRYSER
ncbi:hypothetical protein CesoFtcFv8_025022 [Champsocephalus esox]|uniref:Uncharacterized protein n=1 Tax=Champsocephalus esox TaxID=159716 RepID=A0AAN8GGA9_9TELE|nr:hypothetical protein CesoFtcFv8_025022 [Champsocephalus esox]